MLMEGQLQKFYGARNKCFMGCFAPFPKKNNIANPP